MAKQRNISISTKKRGPKVSAKNVNQKLLNLMRAEKEPSIESMSQRAAHRSLIIGNPKGAKQRELRDRYLDEDSVATQAWKIMEQYKDVGITKAEVVHAIKTNYVSQLHNKWAPRLKIMRDASKEAAK